MALPRFQIDPLSESLGRLPRSRKRLDLNFPRFDKDTELTELPRDLAVLMVGIAARQAASPTAAGWARINRSSDDETLFAPVNGAFNGTVATALMKWQNE